MINAHDLAASIRAKMYSRESVTLGTAFGIASESSRRAGWNDAMRLVLAMLAAAGRRSGYGSGSDE